MSDRRKPWLLELPPPDPPTGPPAAAALPSDTLGVALSGGGIRSATFALGILETLRRRGILPRVDYLSTVSGGGYVGAWLTGNCHRHENWLAADDATGHLWLKSIAHLRRYSNYLSPQLGFFSADTWSMATIWLRNTLLIQSTVILVIATALMLPRPLFEGFIHWPWAGDGRWATILLYVFGIVGIGGNLLRLTSDNQPKILKASSWPIGLSSGILLLGAAWAYGAATDFNPFVTGQVSYRTAVPIAILLVLGGFFLQPFGVWLVAKFQNQDDAATQINYSQGWVQAVVILPLMTTAFLVAAVLWAETIGVPVAGRLRDIDSYGTFVMTAWRYWPFPLSVVFVSIWMLSYCGIRRQSRAGKAAVLLSPFVAVPVLHALLCAVMLLLHQWAQLPDGALRAFVWAPALVTLSFVTTIVVLIGMMGRQSVDSVREWWSRLGAWLGIYATGWMVMTVTAVYGPWAVDWAFSNHWWTSMTVSSGWLATIAAGLFGGASGSTGQAEAGKPPASKLKELVAAVAPLLFIAAVLIAVAYVLNLVIQVNAVLGWDDVSATVLKQGTHGSHEAFFKVSLAVWAGCAIALVIMAWRVDINEFSLNAFYRNRLVRCYLGATRFDDPDRVPQNFTGFDGHDDIRLDQLVPGGASKGPLHIVNCALNLGGSSDLALHTRHSAVFTLSPLFCGSPYISRNQAGKGGPLGYVRTAVYGGTTAAPTLGQAISVSGAAASPNMGYHTSPVVAFLLTLFNVRLGWWFPNTGRTATNVASPHFSLRYLFAELFGGANDKSSFVMISDGGHFENMAAYELIRRRCRVVVICDGECDPGLGFEGLGTLIRVCEVDFNCRITIDVERLRPAGVPAWSQLRHAIGRIDYGQGETGVLIYLKASMTGREDTAVLQYKSSHPEFPHESTGNQFYREDQFESYRRLGQQVAGEVFRENGDANLVVRAERLLREYEFSRTTQPLGGDPFAALV